MILHITTQMELIKLDKSIVQNRQPDGKITPWQLARIYIYTLPFANLDMILKNANLQSNNSIILIYVFYKVIFTAIPSQIEFGMEY